MRGDDFRPLRVATQGWGLPQSMAVARFFCVSSCKRCEFLVPLPSIQFLFLFLFVLLDQSMMMADGHMVISPRLMVVGSNF